MLGAEAHIRARRADRNGANVAGQAASTTGGSGTSGGGSSGKPGTPQRPQRPRELQDPLNHYLYHPLAWQLARRLAHTTLTPNMLSVFGALMVGRR